MSHVFVSYSHDDERVVKPIVKLYRATDATIYIDRTDIPLGAEWRAEIIRAIDACTMVWVFWCRHASVSEEVQSEYMRGIEMHKRTIPILLDPTPVSTPLTAFKWLDMQSAFDAHDEEIYETMTLAEADRIDRAARRGTPLDLSKEHDEPDDRFSDKHYRSDGNLYREGWEYTGDKLIRRRRVVCELSQSQLRIAVEKLKAHFSTDSAGPS